jgi:putative phosphoesterase
VKIGLISDTHGYVDAWEKALEIFKGIDLLIHAGDILGSGPFNPRLGGYGPADLAMSLNKAPFPIVFAKGNCDAEIDTLALEYPIEAPYALIRKGDLSILATHGHLYDDNKLIEMGSMYKLDLIVRGHTHIRGIKKIDKLSIINPGSAALPKNSDEIPSVALIEQRTAKLVSILDGSILQETQI